MTIQLNEEDGGKRLSICISGKLSAEDYEKFVPVFERLGLLHGKLRLLLDMTDFHGWEAAASWADTKFADTHFTDIKRLAMVGENRWQYGMAMFCKPFTKATMRYFVHEEAEKANLWLDQV